MSFRDFRNFTGQTALNALEEAPLGPEIRSPSSSGPWDRFRDPAHNGLRPVLYHPSFQCAPASVFRSVMFLPIVRMFSDTRE